MSRKFNNTVERSDKSLDHIRESILNKLLITIAIIAVFPLMASLYRIVDLGWQNLMWFHIIGYVVISATAIYRKRLPYIIKTLILVLLAFLIGVVATIKMGMVGNGIVFMFFSILFATMFLNARIGGLFIVTSFILLLIMAFGIKNGWIVFDFDVEVIVVSFSTWISRATSFLLFSTFIIASLGSLIHHLAESGEKLKNRSREVTKANEKLSKNIAEIKKTKKALLESERNYREIYNASNDAIIIHDAETGAIIDVNSSMLSMYGYEKEDILGAIPVKISSGIKPYDLPGVEQKIKKARNEGPQLFEWQAKKKSGEFFWVEVNLKFSKLGDEERMISVVRDITDRKRTHEMLIQSEKMLSVGGLAAGMAHEINNPLAGLIQTTDVMVRRLTDTTLPANKKAAEKIGIDIDDIKAFMVKRDILKMTSTIKQSGSRMAEIVNNMLSFARKSDAQISSHSITELFDKTIELAGTDFDLKKHYDFRRIQIEKEYEKNLPLIPCEATKIQQVFLNILNNGAQAMQESEVENPSFLIKVWLDEKRKMVCIAIKDNGPGMDIDTQKRIFEPFFTTKPVGVGTGLGLSVSYFIVTENHKGEIEVDSGPDNGTSFTIRLRV